MRPPPPPPPPPDPDVDFPAGLDGEEDAPKKRKRIDTYYDNKEEAVCARCEILGGGHVCL